MIRFIATLTLASLLTACGQESTVTQTIEITDSNDAVVKLTYDR